MSSRTHPERFWDSFIEEWNNRGSVGIVIPPELEEQIIRYFKYSCAAGAESVIHKLLRTFELTPHFLNKLPYTEVMKTIRNLDPDDNRSFLVITPRDYTKILETEEINEPKTENNGQE